jgi:hypothetical protein
MTTLLQHRDLRPRDIRKLIALHSRDVVWDYGSSPSSEWIYFSFEVQNERARSLEWIDSKCVPSEATVVLRTYPEHYKFKSWQAIYQQIEQILSYQQVTIIDISFSWILEYHPARIARFGRYFKRAEQGAAANP